MARCYHELGEPNKARQRFQEILGAGKQAAEGTRLARYFRLLVIADPAAPPGMVKDPAEEVRVEGTQWLRDYPSFRNTAEAQGLRFLMANNYLALSEKPKITPVLKKRTSIAPANCCRHRSDRE